MVSGKSIMARMIVHTHTSQSIQSLTKLKATWMVVSSAAMAATKMMALAVGHIAAVGGAFFAATMILKDYESALVRAGAIGGLTTAQTAQLGNKLMESASKYGAASTEMAGGVLELTKAGFEFETVMGAIDTITKVNIANNLDYASAAEISTLVMKAFNVEVENLEGHFDKLQYVVNKTLMDMGDFTELLRYAGSTAVTAQVDPTELYAMAGALSDVAQQAGIGARGVNRMMIELLKNSEAFQEWADSLGLGVEIIKDGKLNITELVMAFSKLEMTEDLLVESLERFSIRSARAWLGLRIAAEEYYDLVEGQKEAGGYLEDVVGPQLDTLTVRLGRLKEQMLYAFRTDPEFMSATKRAFDQLEESVMTLMPPLKELVMDLLAQAPQMFGMLIEVLTNLLPILTGGILPVFSAMANVMDKLNKAGILKFIILMLVLKKLSPIFIATWNMIGAAIWRTAITQQMLTQATAGWVTALILLWAISGKTKWALYAIAAAIMAVAVAIVAVKAAGGNWVQAARFAMILGSTVLAAGTAMAMMKATSSEDATYSSAMVSNAAVEASASVGEFAIGTRYAPRTGYAFVHEGEPIGTKASGIFDRGGGATIIIDHSTIYGDEDALKRLIKRIVAEEAEEAYS